MRVILLVTVAEILLVHVVSSQWGERRVRGEGTYNPKSAWKFVDSRRRVLPDIDGKQGEELNRCDQYCNRFECPIFLLTK